MSTDSKPASTETPSSPSASSGAPSAAPADNGGAPGQRPGGNRSGGPGGPGGGGNRPGQRRDNRGGPRRDNRRRDEPSDGPTMIEKVVFINRCAKVVKGGRRFSFSALSVVGDGKGKLGVGYGKANEVPEAIRKSTAHANKHMVTVKLKGDTIPHEVLGESDGGKVLLRPAVTGTGLIAGGGVRAVLEAAGVKNVLTKSLGSNNHLAVVNATLAGLLQLRTYEEVKAARKS